MTGKRMQISSKERGCTATCLVAELTNGIKDLFSGSLHKPITNGNCADQNEITDPYLQVRKS